MMHFPRQFAAFSRSKPQDNQEIKGVRYDAFPLRSGVKFPTGENPSKSNALAGQPEQRRAASGSEKYPDQKGLQILRTNKSALRSSVFTAPLAQKKGGEREIQPQIGLDETPEFSDESFKTASSGGDRFASDDDAEFVQPLQELHQQKLGNFALAHKSAKLIVALDFLPGFTSKLDDKIRSAFTARDVEIKQNNSDVSINFIVGVLQQITGIHEKNGSEPSAHSRVSDGAVNSLGIQAKSLLAELNDRKKNGSLNLDEVDWRTPIGTPAKCTEDEIRNLPIKMATDLAGNKWPIKVRTPVLKPDPRVNELLFLIGKKYGLKIDISVFSGNKSTDRLEESSSFKSGARDATKLALLNLDGQFLPLCKANLTNPGLSPALRKSRKTIAARIDAAFADILRPARREARNKTDLQLLKYMESIDFNPHTAEEVEHAKEWHKRRDCFAGKQGGKNAGTALMNSEQAVADLNSLRLKEVVSPKIITARERRILNKANEFANIQAYKLPS